MHLKRRDAGGIYAGNMNTADVCMQATHMFSASTYSCTSFVPSYFICTFSKLLPEVFCQDGCQGEFGAVGGSFLDIFFLALFLAVEFLPEVQSPSFQKASRSWFGILHLKGFQRLLRCIFCVKNQLACLAAFSWFRFQMLFSPKTFFTRACLQQSGNFTGI